MAEAAIVGGGLAGMIAALKLLERGCRVTIFESSDRLGGKAGANTNGTERNEHAYHIFPAWYHNIWEIVKALGIAENFVDCSDLTELKRGQFPDKQYTYRNITSWRSGLQNIFAGFVPPGDMFLFYAAICDLLSQRYARRAYLDEISITGFIRGKPYYCKNVELQFTELILKGLSVPTYELSAMTMQRVMSFWVRAPLPLFRIARGNLQQFWIEPIQRRIEELGGIIKFDHQLRRIHVADREVSRLSFESATGERTELNVSAADGRVVLALPSDKLGQLIDDEVYLASPNLGHVFQLRSSPLAAFNIYLKRWVPGIPRSHVLLAGSKFALSFIDVSQTWAGYDKTVLNCMASDYVSLIGLDSETAFAELFAELREFLPMITWDDIDHFDMQTHKAEPLFTNTVGAWAFRPSESDQPELRTRSGTTIRNLHLAGDYCRSAIDLVSMEGAVSTGLLAAEAVRKQLGLEGPIETQSPATPPRWIWLVLKVLSWPLSALLGSIARTRDRISPDQEG